MADRERLICAADALEEGGRGVRFEFDGDLLVPSSDVYKAGREFNQLVAAGKAQAKYDDLEGDLAHAAPAGEKF